MARGLNYVKIDLNILKISTYIENNNKRNGQKFLVPANNIFNRYFWFKYPISFKLGLKMCINKTYVQVFSIIFNWYTLEKLRRRLILLSIF